MFIHWNFSALGGDYSDGFATSELNPTRTYTTVQAAAKVQDEAPANQGMWIEVIKKGLKEAE